MVYGAKVRATDGLIFGGVDGKPLFDVYAFDNVAALRAATDAVWDDGYGHKFLRVSRRDVDRWFGWDWEMSRRGLICRAEMSAFECETDPDERPDVIASGLSNAEASALVTRAEQEGVHSLCAPDACRVCMRATTMGGNLKGWDIPGDLVMLMVEYRCRHVYYVGEQGTDTETVLYEAAQVLCPPNEPLGEWIASWTIAD